jgi:signal transduction histidine kinase
VHVLAIVPSATAAIDLFATLLLAIAFVRRRADREYWFAALLALASAVQAVGTQLTTHPVVGGVPAPIAHCIASLGLLVALPVAVHFAIAYRHVQVPGYVFAAVYGAATGLAAVDLGRPFTSSDGHASRSLFGAPAAMAYAPRLGPDGLAEHGAAVLAAAVVLVLVGRAYLTGRQGALAIVIGAAVLLATAINDVGVASGALATSYLSDTGLAALVVGIATTPSARYAEVSIELDRRTRELRTRTGELRRSYEELRTAQEELVKKEQLAVVGELAAVIAHEVRNPLAIIANAVAGLRKQAISRVDHDVLLAILDEEASRLNRLVTDLLRYARPVNVQRTYVALDDLLERALALANTGAKSISMGLTMEVNERHFWGDANLLRQVFDNLIDNAVQAMQPGGVLTICVRAATEGGLDGLAVDIIDTGEGMDTQVRSRALDPFFTTRPSGTGLGLAIVDRIVDAHGGRLSIESRAGEGTTVTVFLPRQSAGDPPATQRARSRGGSDVRA